MPKTGRPLKHGAPLVGKLVRLPGELWDAVAEKARAEGKSLNDAMIAAACKWVGRKKRVGDVGSTESVFDRERSEQV